jgi:peptide/nickel transport system substrate-binding protein
VIAVPTGPTSLAPNTVNEEFTDSVLGNVYEPLVNLDPVLGLEPALAETWENPDELTWTFRLREGVRFHNGHLLTASDVVTCLERARKDSASATRAYFAPVRSFEAPDSRTVVIHTDRRFDLLAARLTALYIWADPDRPGEPAPGTGPYRIHSWTPGGSTVLEAFEGYRTAVSIRQVEFRTLPDAAERVRAVQAGEVQMALDVPAENMAALASSATLRTVSVNGLRVIFLAMDCAHARSPHVDNGDNPFRDIRVRRAVALAIDREALVRDALGGFGEVVDEIASPQEIGGRVESLPRRAYDPSEARRLLASAGYKGGFEVELDYLSKYRSVEGVVKALKSQLGAVGVTIDPHTGTMSEMSSRIEARDVAFYLAGWVSDTGESGSSYEALLHTPKEGFGIYNGGGYSNPDVDRLIEASANARSMGARSASLARVARTIYDDVPVIPLYRQADLYAMARGLQFTPRLDRRLKVADMVWSTVGPKASSAAPR